jgi:hypothetical protein
MIKDDEIPVLLNFQSLAHLATLVNRELVKLEKRIAEVEAKKEIKTEIKIEVEEKQEVPVVKTIQQRRTSKDK